MDDDTKDALAVEVCCVVVALGCEGSAGEARMIEVAGYANEALTTVNQQTRL
jgi:hypothetical protein